MAVKILLHGRWQNSPLIDQKEYIDGAETYNVSRTRPVKRFETGSSTEKMYMRLGQDSETQDILFTSSCILHVRGVLNNLKSVFK